MINFIYGTDSYRIREKEQELLAHFSVGDSNNINLTKIDGAEFNIAKFEQAISEVSFFGGEKVVVIYNLLTENKDSELKGKVADRIKKGISIKIVFIEHNDPDKREKLFKTLKDERTKGLKNNIENFYFGPLTDFELRQWIENQVKKSKFKIDREAWEALALAVGPNLWRLKNEIDKLVLYAKSQNCDRITSSDVSEMVESEFNPNIFQFIEAIATGNKKRSAQLLSQFINKGENENYLLSMIIYQFRTLIMIKDLQDRGKSSREIASEARLNPYVVQKSLPTLRHYSLGDLISFYQKLSQFDVKIKIGQIDPRVAVDILVAG